MSVFDNLARIAIFLLLLIGIGFMICGLFEGIINKLVRTDISNRTSVIKKLKLYLIVNGVTIIIFSVLEILNEAYGFLVIYVVIMWIISTILLLHKLKHIS